MTLAIYVHCFPDSAFHLCFHSVGIMRPTISTCACVHVWAIFSMFTRSIHYCAHTTHGQCFCVSVCIPVQPYQWSQLLFLCVLWNGREVICRATLAAELELHVVLVLHAHLQIDVPTVCQIYSSTGIKWYHKPTNQSIRVKMGICKVNPYVYKKTNLMGSLNGEKTEQ